MSLLNVPFVRFPPVASSPTCSLSRPSASSTSLERNRMNPQCFWSLEWNVWLLGHSDPTRHRLQPRSTRRQQDVSSAQKGFAAQAPVMGCSGPPKLCATRMPLSWRTSQATTKHRQCTLHLLHSRPTSLQHQQRTSHRLHSRCTHSDLTACRHRGAECVGIMVSLPAATAPQDCEVPVPINTESPGDRNDLYVDAGVHGSHDGCTSSVGLVGSENKTTLTQNFTNFEWKLDVLTDGHRANPERRGVARRL